MIRSFRHPDTKRLEAWRCDRAGKHSIRLTPITPGELLDEEFLQTLGVSQYRLAKAIDVPASRISEIVAGRRAISADTDLRLCRFLGLSHWWLHRRSGLFLTPTQGVPPSPDGSRPSIN